MFNKTIMIIGIVSIIYGVLTLIPKLGDRIIPLSLQREKAWSKRYTRYFGLSFVTLGLGWMIWSIRFSNMESTLVRLITLCILSLPSLIFTYIYEKQFVKERDNKEKWRATITIVGRQKTRKVSPCFIIHQRKKVVDNLRRKWLCQANQD